MTVDQLINRYVDRTGDCWEWTGAKNNGYGKARFGDRMHGAHRLIYTHLVGPIPLGLTIDHLCFNRSCVNPAHLEPVTIQENVARAAARRREANSCVHGHELTPDNVWVNGRKQRVCRTCRRRWSADSYRKQRQKIAVQRMCEGAAS